MSGPFVLIRSTYGDEEAARRAARDLIAARVACCAHVSRIDSVYEWQGEMVEESEWMLEARVLAEQAQVCREAVLAGHPYDEPLVEMLDVAWAAPGYVQWARTAHGA